MTFTRLAGQTLLALTMTTGCFAASVEYYSDKSTFNTEAPASMALETFEAGSVDGMAQILTSAGQTQNPVNSINSNAVFAPGDIQPNVNFYLTSPNDESAIGWYVYNTGGNTLMMTANYGLRITFDTPVYWFGLDIMNPFGGGTSGTITLLDSDSETIGSTEYTSAGFVGFHSFANGISSVEFSNSWVDFDNVTWETTNDVSETPEPGSFLLAGAGIAGAWFVRRRRQARA